MPNRTLLNCGRIWMLAAIAAAVQMAAAEPPGTPATDQGKARPPNILFIMSDDHAAHAISAYGSKINTTPNIDRLAREGMRFTNCFCENSLCSPSRAAIMTGSFSCRNGVLNLSIPLDPSRPTFPTALRQAGYRTAIVGKWHLHRNPAEFDHWDILPEQGVYFDPPFLTPGKRSQAKGYVTDIITDKCIDWLEHRDAAKPFMLMCMHKAPHRPWQPDAKHAHMYDNVDIPEPATFNDDYATRSDAARAQKMSIEHDLTRTDLKQDPPQGLTPAQLKHWKYERFIKDYLACIASVDDSVGKLLDYLDAHGLADNTIVVYTSDQGFFLGDHGWFDKRWMYEEALRMPLIVRYPGHVAPGSVCGSFVQNIDFAPTLLDFAGALPDRGMQGVSAKPLLEGKTPDSWRKAIYYHYFEEGTEHHVAAHFGVRTERYKLIRFYSEVKAWEFYDLTKDPHELHNAYGQPEYAPVIADLTKQLEGLRQTYGDTTGSLADPTIVETLGDEAKALLPLVKTEVGKAFLTAAKELPMPEPATRTVYRDKERGLAITAADWGKLAAEEQAKFKPRECGPEFYYTTGYGTPLVYARPWDVLAAAAEWKSGSDLSGKRVLDFGYGGVGPLRILASMGADAHGVDVEPLFEALYSEPGDIGVIKGAAGGTSMQGKVVLHTGRWPADAKLREQVGSGYDVFISKNTLKRGYIHPARAVDEKYLVKLGVDDEAYVRAVFDLLKPGGWAIIYNISPAQNPPDKPYLPHADGQCPFPRELLEKVGFKVVEFDKVDTEAALDFWMALGINEGKSREATAEDLFAWCTILRKPS